MNETKKEVPENAFTNYTALSSTSNEMAGGVVLLFRYNVEFAQIKELETEDNNNIVAAANIRGLKILTTTAYIKPEDRSELIELMKSLEACKSYADKNHMECVLFFGDCNARHYYWGDQKCNEIGNELLSLLPTFSILNDGEPTFVSVNGQSKFDMCICYGNFINQYNYSLTTDVDTELFTGTPSRGHVPVKVTLFKSTHVYSKEKPWIEKAMWEEWSMHLETEMLTRKTSEDASEMWDSFKNSLRDATQLFSPSKKVTKHSKPFWCPELSIASKELRLTKRKFRYKSNHANLKQLVEAKATFKQLISEKASDWMKDYLKALGHK